jgi:tetratricopeptide (TPR) repeat protein
MMARWSPDTRRLAAREWIAVLALLAGALGCASVAPGDGTAAGSVVDAQADPSSAADAPAADAVDPRSAARRALASAEERDGPDSPEATRARVLLADIEFRHDLYSARALYLRALPDLQRELGDDPLVAAVLQRLARIDYLLGNLPSALAHGRSALRTAEQAFGPQHPQVALALLSLAEIALAAGFDERARELADTVGELLTTLDSADPSTALLVASPLGSLEGKLGDFERAEALLLRGLAAAEDAEGADSLVAAARLNDLAYVYARSGRIEEATPRVERAVQILGREAGRDSVPYALGLDTLGVVRTQQGRGAEALEQLERALSIIGPAFGRDSPVLFDVLEHYRAALAALGDERAEDAVGTRLEATRGRRNERLRVALVQTPEAAPEASAAPRFRSESFGYAVDLSSTEWSAWERVAAFMPLAEFGALYRDAGGFAVLPVSYFGSAPEPAVAVPALLGLIQSSDASGAVPLRVDGFEGVEVVTTRLRDNAAYLYRARALSGAHAGFVILAWVARDKVTNADAALEAVERVRLDPDRVPTLDVRRLSAPERTRHGTFLNEVGLRYAQRGRYATAVDFLERATATSIDDPILFENLVRVQITAGHYGPALDALQTGVARFAEYPQLRAYRAYAAAQTGNHAAAVADYERAFDLGVDDENLFESWIESLWLTGRYDEAFTRLEARIERTRSMRLRVLHAALLRQHGQAERAVTELRELEEEAPDDPAVLVALVHALAETERHREAIEVCESAVARIGPSADLYAAQATSEYALGDYGAAAASLERAIALDPGNASLQQMAVHVAGLAGTAERELAREPIDPVSIPDALVQLDAARAPDGSDDYGAAYDFWAEAFHFEAGRELRRTTYFRARITDARGIERFASLRIPYHPASERIFVNELVVRDAQGLVTARGDVSGSYVLDPPEGGQASPLKVLHVPVPGLEPGGSFEMRVTRSEVGAPVRFAFVDHAFSRSIPVGRSAVVLSGDVDRVAADASTEVERRAVQGAAAWWIDAPLPVYWEPLLPRGGPQLPSLRLNERGADWDALARGYRAELEPFVAPVPEAEALADRVLDGLSGSNHGERVRVLTAAARDALSYTAVEFGARMRTPQPLATTLARGYGDSKDHALLLVQLLRRAGVDSQLALVSLSGRVNPQTPALDQFDHMLVYCEACGAGFLDATDKDYASESGIPRNLGGARALILDAAHPRLVEIPEDDPALHFLEVERTVRIEADGATRVAENLVFAGSVGAAVRGALRGLEPSEWEAAFQQRLAEALPASRLRSFEAEHVETPDRALELSLEYDLQDLFAATTDSLVGRLPAPWEHSLVSVPPVDPRRADFALANPLRIASTVSVIAPPGYAFRGQRVTHQRGTRFVRWQATVIPGRLPRVDANQVRPLLLHFELDRPAGRHAADDYAHFYEESTDAARFLGATLQLVPFGD